MSSQESFSATYTSAPLGPPFGTDPAFSGATTYHLASMITADTLPYQFAYDNAGAGELTQFTFPSGGHLRWTHTTDPYIGNRSLRAVTSRYLAADRRAPPSGITRSHETTQRPRPFIRPQLWWMPAASARKRGTF